ncbi:MAG: hypothetical protein EXS09_11350 [Gemmataceae bacterium]|nr:hypothetical protein [Gemmataceae bacterium]
MRNFRFLLPLLVAVPAPAQEPAASADDFFPLVAGTTWTYKVSGQEDRFSVKAVRQEMIGTQTCMLMEAMLKDKVVATEHLAFTKNGLYRFRADKEDIDPPVCVLKLPTTRNLRWNAEYKLGTRSAKYTFSSATTEITVPAGKFKAVTVQTDSNEAPGRGTLTWISYAEGIGMVRQAIVEGKGRPALSLELEKFETVPKP